MSNTLEINFEIPPLWQSIGGIRERISQDDRVRGKGEDLVNSTVMVASELLENAVKYGHHNRSAQPVTFALNVSDEAIQIDVSNTLDPNHDLSAFQRIVERIQKSDNPEQLYIERLTECLNDPKQGESCLGLYRIAYEAEFSLRYALNDGVLTTTAERKF